MQPIGLDVPLSELEAEESLFEISKYDHTDNHDKMIRDIAKNRVNQRRYNRPIPTPQTQDQEKKKKDQGEEPYKLFRQTYQSLASRPVSLSMYYFIQPTTWSLMIGCRGEDSLLRAK